jgi:hypothetical protein
MMSSVQQNDFGEQFNFLSSFYQVYNPLGFYFYLICYTISTFLENLFLDLMVIGYGAYFVSLLN